MIASHSRLHQRYYLSVHVMFRCRNNWNILYRFFIFELVAPAKWSQTCNSFIYISLDSMHTAHAADDITYKVNVCISHSGEKIFHIDFQKKFFRSAQWNLLPPHRYMRYNDSKCTLSDGNQDFIIVITIIYGNFTH